MMKQDIPTASLVVEEATAVDAAGAGFEPAELLAELKARAASEQQPTQLPDHLPLKAIATLPALFQPRGLAENHVYELTRVAKSGAMLDPVTVIQIGSTPYLVDGHHRREAYIAANVTKPVPVAYFRGTVEEAVLEAGRANSKAKQPMTNTERQDFAWRLVKMGGYKRPQVVEAAGVSMRQVAIMRDALKALGPDAYEVDRWWQARQRAAGKDVPDLSDEDREEQLEAQAADYARRLRKEFGGKLISNPELAARALDIYFGRKLPELLRDLRERAPDDMDEDDETDF
jgi:hypothetical protein